MIRQLFTYIVGYMFYDNDHPNPEYHYVSVEKILFWVTVITLGTMFYFLSPAHAHMEDHSGCVTVPKYNIIKLNTRPYYEGVSSDNRDYVVQFNLRGLERADLEYRFVLAPVSQWKNKQKPEPIHWNPVGVWVDSDDQIGWDDWWIDPRGNGNCKDYIHMKWSEEHGHWILWIAHHDEKEASLHADDTR